jgi:hypothetical protein
MRRFFGVILISLFASSLFAQDDSPKNYSLNGYVKYLNTTTFNEVESPWIIENTIHNRLNFSWYLNQNFTFSTSMRNRLIYGDYVKLIPNYDKLVETDNGFMNFLTNNIYSINSSVLTTSFDRLFVEYNVGNFTATLGRQRINWGQSFAWNPNDIFNAYSFFDFDYEERPGSDAVRLQYYPNYTSAAEVAVKIDRNNQITAAALYRFNKLGYDFQFLAGIIDSTDFVFGSGWSGSISNIGFTGEVSYFHPQDNASDSLGIVIATAGLNYMFSSSLSISFEGIYNGYFSNLNMNSFSSLYFMPLSVKTISFSKFSWFGQVAYPIHPLLNSSLAVMYFPSLGNGYFIMPSLAYSASQSVEVSLLGQRFSGDFNGVSEELNMIFIRFRLSF